MSIQSTVSKMWAKAFIHLLLNQFYGIRCFIFSTLEFILSGSKVLLPRYGQKRSFSGFETSFTAFAVLFLALLWLFCVNRIYHCQDVGESVYLPAFKQVLRHLLFFF